MVAIAQQYDANGNRTSGGYKTGANNRLVYEGYYTYSYDKNGNRTAKFVDTNHSGKFDSGDGEGTVYGYDYRNRLSYVISESTYNTITQQVYYGYDYLNRQIIKMKDNYPADGNMDEYRYNVYQGADPVMEIYDQDGLANNGYAGDISHIYLYGPGKDQIIAVDSASGTLFGLADQEGTIRDVIRLDSPGNYSYWHRDYDSFGKVVYDDGPDYLFGKDGMAIDPDVYLYRTDSRLYDPLTAYWIKVDPSGFSSNDPNLYRFCGNDPYNKNDSTGKRWTDTVGTSLSVGSNYNQGMRS